MGRITVFLFIFCDIFECLGFGLDRSGMPDKNALFYNSLGGSFLSERNVDIFRKSRPPFAVSLILLYTFAFCP